MNGPGFESTRSASADSIPHWLWNALPLVGIVLLGWDPLVVVLLYWLEFGVRLLLNAPKIMLASGDRTGRLPDDVGCWPDGPTIRLGTAWLAILSVVVYGLAYLVVTSGSPLWSVFGEITLSRSGAGEIAAGTMVLTVGAMLGSQLLAFRTEFLGKCEYERVTPAIQFVRPIGHLWLFFLVLLFASGHTVFDGNPMMLATVLILFKTAGDVLARRGLRIQPPSEAARSRTESFTPTAPPNWTGEPSVRALTLVWTPVIAAGSVLAVSLTLGLYGLLILDVAGQPYTGVLALGGMFLVATIGLTAFGVVVLRRRYGGLEYHIYPTGIAIYNTRHETVVRFVPYHTIEDCTCYRGVLPRALGLSSVCLRLEEPPSGARDGRFRTVFSSRESASFGADDDDVDVMLRALPVTEAQRARELIDNHHRQRQTEAKTA
ncbi:hypothetical protein C483_00625 [Natrialba hulunbeirensis JCM 10989]|uniref:Uncharacterized protein n=1 Tax=Natrialba hulunbeirensis JCM 10989 TaxID=1227493 RepID=M0AEH2_9EURY|nr:DUF6498-containing protein [Natrialba hulunbeirensis]ELY95738.1 hypothetical protein C483_00625 [Natrialba hulunbeirensis JCM 10989]